MNRLGKVLVIVLSVIMALTCFAGCAPKEQFDTEEWCSNVLEGVEETEYVICVSKAIPEGQQILDEINKAIDAKAATLIKEYSPEDLTQRISDANAKEMFFKLNELREKEGVDPLNIYAHLYNPYEYSNGPGAFAMGIDVEICYSVAITLGRSIIFNEPSLEVGYQKVKSGEGDILISAIAKTPELEKDFYVSKVYDKGTQQIVSLNTRRLHKIKDMKGLRIGVIADRTGEKLISEAIEKGVLKNSGAEIHVFATDTEAKNAIQNERIDCIVMDEKPAVRTVARMIKERTNTGFW